MAKIHDIQYWYDQWGGGGEGLYQAIGNVRLDEINQTGHLNKLLKIAEDYAYKGDIDYVAEVLREAHDEASFSSDREWIQALLDFIFNIEQYS